MSLILRPDLEADEIPAITLVAAMSVAEAIRRLAGVPAMIKWPNDVMVSGRKVCGILTEMKAQPDRVDFLVLGIGINVNTPKSKLPGAATSLRHELDAPVNRAELVRGFLERFEKDYRLFRKKGFAALRGECKKHSTVLGNRFDFRPFHLDRASQDLHSVDVPYQVTRHVVAHGRADQHRQCGQPAGREQPLESRARARFRFRLQTAVIDLRRHHMIRVYRQ